MEIHFKGPLYKVQKCLADFIDTSSHWGSVILQTLCSVFCFLNMIVKLDLGNFFLEYFYPSIFLPLGSVLNNQCVLVSFFQFQTKLSHVLVFLIMASFKDNEI